MTNSIHYTTASIYDCFKSDGNRAVYVEQENIFKIYI